MQGYLEIWHGFIKRWNKYYFRIHDDTLMFGPKKQQIQGKVSLKIAQIVTTIDDPVSFIVHTGTQTLHLRAYSIEERVNWFKKLKGVQKQVEQANYIKQMSSIDSKNTKTKILEQLTIQLWQCHADLENIIDEVTQRVKISSVKNLLDKLRITVQEIKFKNSSALKIMEEYISDMSRKRGFSQQIHGLYNGNNGNDSSWNINKNKNFFREQQHKYNNSIGEETRFLSFTEDHSSYPKIPSTPSKIFKKKLGTLKTTKNHSNGNIFGQMSQDDQTPLSPMLPLEKRKSSYKKNIEHYSYNSSHKNESQSEVEAYNYGAGMKINKKSHQITTHPIKEKILNQNQAFADLVQNMPKGSQRSQLPQKYTPDKKFSIIQTFSKAGTDFTKFSFPVTMNEPISMLQKGCERMVYSRLLDQANSQLTPQLRMLSISAFVVSQYSTSENRVKKPFNPLLGETFEFIDDQRQFKYLSQQVSHHPPISVLYARSNNYQMTDDTKAKTSFTGTSIKFTPESKGRITLEKHKDCYIFNKCTTTVNGFMIGNMHVENAGKIQINCKKFNTKAVLMFRQSSFWSKENSFAVEGNVFINNKEIYGIKGKWNKYLMANQYANSNSSFKIWQKTEEAKPQYYNFSQSTLQLNFLNTSLLDIIAPTDSRLRPDLRALQYQNLEFASSEKNRLEEKQRRRKKQNETLGKNHEILWFNLETDEDGNEFYVGKQNYWQERRRGIWPNCLDLF